MELMLLETKLDCFFFQSARLLQATEVSSLSNQCEQATRILTVLMLRFESSRLAGSMVTVKPSTFCETDRSLA